LREKGCIRATYALEPPPPPERSETLVELSAAPEALEAFFELQAPRAPAQAALLMHLLEHPDGVLPRRALLQATGASLGSLRGLESRGLVRMVQAHAPPAPAAPPSPVLTPAQAHAVNALRTALEQGAYQSFLLFGVTGSGKTEVYLRAAAEREANLFIHVAGGADPVHDPLHFTRLRACQAMLPRFPATTTMMAVSPLLASATGPRSVAYKAIVARNYGCTHLIVGGESAANGSQRRGVDALGLDPERQARLRQAVGVELVPFPRLLYVEDQDTYLTEDALPEGVRGLSMTDAELRRRLMHDLRVPEWYAYPEVVEELRRAYPPRHRQGFTVFFTGLSGAGKSTIARALAVKLMELGERRVTLLDGDIVRKHLSSELGFSREHRDINIRRIGFVASEITKNGGVAICAPIAPYRATRRDVRGMIEPWGGFIEVHVSTPIEVCEARDRKGLYAKARAGLIPEFTGVSDPYEAPESPELAIDTSQYSVEEAVQKVVLKLEHEGYLR
jgi:sulfate adenylyltransferase